MNVRIEILKTIHCYEPTSIDGEGYESIKSLKGNQKYFKSDDDNFFSKKQHHFPVIIDPDGSMWNQGNLYLIDKIKGFEKAKYRTIESIARDIAYFRQWVIDEDIDYLCSPKRPRQRPTYQFTVFLHDEVRLQNIQKSTAKRRLTSVINLYRWLIKNGHRFEFPLWVESEGSVSFKDSRGFHHQKKLTSTDLVKTFQTIKSTDDYGDCIQDGAKLRPLPKDEQEILIQSLIDISNTEMTLSFFLALTTGARKQTVFTLRVSNFCDASREGTKFVRMKVGNGTLIDTKYGKQMVILVPTWLYEKTRIYLSSERYKKRIDTAYHHFDNPDDQYIFLTKSGRPYYSSESDLNNEKYPSGVDTLSRT